jgi:transcriptional regulator with XRE-family HTH domain
MSDTTDMRELLEYLVASGLTLREIADRLDMNKAEVQRAFALAGVAMPMPPSRGYGTYRTRVTDVPRLFRLWHETDLSQAAIARELGVSEGAIKRAVKHFGLPPRGQHAAGLAANDDDVPADEADASGDSLRLAPSVWAAAEEVRKRWTSEEEYSRRVTRVQPVLLQSFSFERQAT